MKKKIRNSKQYVFSFMEGEDIETIFTFNWDGSTNNDIRINYNFNNCISNNDIRINNDCVSNIIYGNYMPIYASTMFGTWSTT